MSTTATSPKMTSLPLSVIRVSPHNPRKRFDEAKLKELADSIRADGVLEPILVRPVKVNPDGHCYELVAGERRWRASGLAGLKEIPAIVREIDAAKALELAVIENLQRENLNPIEEAEGYQRLIKEHRYSAEDLAARVGKSKGYIYTRLKLTVLPQAAKEALWEERINASVALLIARIPDPKVQARATAVILGGEGRGEPMNYREAARYVQEECMLSLAEAPFPTKDPNLVPEAGACAACPKRTGNNPDLFGDVKRGDLCTDLACFNAKKEAHWSGLQEQAQAGGATVLGPRESKQLFSCGRLAWHTRYVDLDAACADDPKRRTWLKLLGRNTPKHALARDDQGRAHRLVVRSEALTALKKAGHVFKLRDECFAAGEPPVERHQQEEATRRRRLEVLRRSSEEAIGAIVAKAEKKEPDSAFWRLLLQGIAEASGHDVLRTVAKRRQWAESKGRPEDVLPRASQGMNAGQLRALVLEMVTTRGAYRTFGTPSFGKGLIGGCDVYGIDLKKIETAVKAKLAEKGGRK